MHTSKPRVELHPQRKVVLPHWLNSHPNANSANTWRFALQTHFSIVQHTNKTILFSQVEAFSALDIALDAENRVFHLRSACELEDNLIFSQLELALKNRYSFAMAQAIIITSIWDARFLTGLAFDHTLSQKIRDWSKRVKAEREFGDWLRTIRPELFPELTEVARYAALESKSISQTLDSPVLLAEICAKNKSGPLNSFFWTGTAAIGSVGLKAALWRRFEQARASIATAYHAAGQERGLWYTREMDKATFMHTVCHPISNVNGRPLPSTLPPCAAFVAEVRRKQKLKSS